MSTKEEKIIDEAIKITQMYPSTTISVMLIKRIAIIEEKVSTLKDIVARQEKEIALLKNEKPESSFAY